MESCLGALLPLFERERAAGRATALAVLLSTAGSTYQRPGALLLISAGGAYAGLISGGCLEGDLAAHARSVIETGRAQRVTYDLRNPNDLIWGLGAGCEGAMHILMLRVGPAEGWQPLAHLAHAFAAHEATAVGLVAESDAPDIALGAVALAGPDTANRLTAAGQQALAAASRSSEPQWLELPGRCRLFLLPLALPPRIVVLGAGPDVVPVVQIAAQLGWKVTVIDHRAGLLLAERFPAAEQLIEAGPEQFLALTNERPFDAAVIMTHQLETDREYLRVLARTALPYVGLLGPPGRAARLLGEIGSDAHRLGERLHAPVGLDLGGRSPQAIAVSIVAEILSVRNGRVARPAPPR